MTLKQDLTSTKAELVELKRNYTNLLRAYVMMEEELRTYKEHNK